MNIQLSPKILLFLLAIALPGGVLLLLLPLVNSVKARVRERLLLQSQPTPPPDVG